MTKKVIEKQFLKVNIHFEREISTIQIFTILEINLIFLLKKSLA